MSRPIRYAILSAELATESAVYNTGATMELIERLHVAGLAHVEAAGVWQGANERSFVVYIPTDEGLEFVAKCALLYKQAAYVVVDESGDARMEFPLSGSESIGRMREVPRAVAEASDGYTRVGSTYLLASKLASKSTSK